MPILLILNFKCFKPCMVKEIYNIVNGFCLAPLYGEFCFIA